MLSPTTTPQNSGEKPMREKPRDLPFPLNIYQSAIGKKWVMAVSGLMLVGFVFAHMIGNLKIYLGQVEHNGVLDYDTDHYAETLRNLLVPIFPEGVVLWGMRLGLLAALLLHIHSAYTLSMLSRKSDNAYAGKRDFLAANWASRSMRLTGPIVALYIVIHLADLTLGFGIATGEFEHGQVYENVVHSLGRPIVAIGYIIANIAVAVHIYHGMWSAFQSLGINNPAYNTLRRTAAQVISGLILIGNVSFPIAVLTDIVSI